MGTLEKKQRKFFDDWKSELQSQGQTFFVEDGAFDPDKYEYSEVKILALMKELPSQEFGFVFGEGVRNNLVNKGRFEFVKRDALRKIAGRIACVREVIEKNNQNFNYSDVKKEAIQSKHIIRYFLESAYINIKKYNGLPRSSQKDLENTIERDREKLQYQINELLNPDVILCGMKIHYYKMLNNRKNPIQHIASQDNLVNVYAEDLGYKKRLIVETYHPSYVFSERILLESMKEALLKIKR